MDDAGSSYFVDPSGSIVSIGAADAPSVIHQGYVPASPEQIRDIQLQQQYGGTGQAVAGAVEKGLSALTFGGSAWAERAVGVSAADMRGRSEANPVAGGIGTAAGIVAPAILSLGTSTPVSAASAAGAGARAAGAGALRTAAEYSAPSLISRLGRGAASAVVGAAPEEMGAVGRIATKAAASMIGSGVEGAAYGLGSVVEESALGDPNLTAQSALARVGMFSALGGGFGLLTGAAEGALPLAVAKSKQVLGDVYGWGKGKLGKFYSGSEAFTGTAGDTATLMMEHVPELHVFERAIPGITKEVAGATPETAAWLIGNQNKLIEAEAAFPGISKKLAGTSPETADLLLNNWKSIITDPVERTRIAATMSKGGQDVLDTVGNMLKQADREILPSATKGLVADADQAAIKNTYAKFNDSMNGAIEKMRAKPDLFHSAYPATLEEIRAGMVRDAWGLESNGVIDAESAFTRMKALRQSLGDNVEWRASRLGDLSLDQRNANNVMRDLYFQVRDSIQDPAVFGRAGAIQAGLDEARTEWSRLVNRGAEFNGQFMQRGKLAPSKVDTWLNQMASAKGDVRSTEWGRMMDSARKVTDKVNDLYRAAPVGEFDHAAATELMDRTAQATAEARQKAAITQTWNQLSPGPKYGSAAAAGSDEALAEKIAEKMGHHFVPSVLEAPVVAAKGVYSLAHRVDRGVAVLSALERSGQWVGSRIDRGVAAMLSDANVARTVGRSEAAAGIGRMFGVDKQGPGAFERRMSEVNRLSDPNTLHGALSQQTENVHEHAPNSAQAMAVASSRAVAFLRSKAPQPPQMGPLAGKWQASPSEIAKFHRYYEATNKPLSILKQASAGTLSPEAVEAVATVYPELMTKIRTQLLDKISGSRTPPSYRARMMTSMLLGSDTDGSLAGMQKMQSAYSMPAAHPQAPKGGAGALGKITLSNRLLTSQQATAQRK